MRILYKIIPVILLFNMLLIAQQSEVEKSEHQSKIKYAGVRSSSYGIKPFPDTTGWKNAITAMQSNFEGSIACGIWIVGRMAGDETCYLEFPSDKEISNIKFAESDKHEIYLDYFDRNGIKVFLQVESASAEVLDVIDIVLNRYKHHSCVIGFGVDVEWYKRADYPEWGVKVDDDLAEKWEKKVKSHNGSYRLFLKHWDYNWMPPKYRGDLVFVDDSQIFEGLEPMVKEFKIWADKFKPNAVYFQIGYPSDRKWWDKFDNPPKFMGEKITEQIEENECGIIWVDFTLDEVAPVK